MKLFISTLISGVTIFVLATPSLSAASQSCQATGFGEPAGLCATSSAKTEVAAQKPRVEPSVQEAGRTTGNATQGVLTSIHADYSRSKRGSTDGGRHYYLQTSKGMVLINRNSSIVTKHLGKRATLNKTKRNSTSAHVRTSSVYSAPITTGAQKIAVIMLTYDGQSAMDRNKISSTFFGENSVSSFYNKESYGKLSFTGDIYGSYSMLFNPANCANDWKDNYFKFGEEAATKDGYNPDNYEHVVFIWPYSGACGFAGRGMKPGKYSYLNGDQPVSIAAHELGHNFGLDHASSFDCSNGAENNMKTLAVTASNCKAKEYGDPFDVMGTGRDTQNSPWNKIRLGFLPNEAQQVVRTPGIYKLYTSDQTVPGNNAAMLRSPNAITVNSTQRYLNISYRIVTESDGITSKNLVVQSNLDVNNTSNQSRGRELTYYLNIPNGFDQEILSTSDIIGQNFYYPEYKMGGTVLKETPNYVLIYIGMKQDIEPPTKPKKLRIKSKRGVKYLIWQLSKDNYKFVTYSVYTKTNRHWITDASKAKIRLDNLQVGKPYLIYAIDGNNNYSKARLFIKKASKLSPSGGR